MWRLCCTFFLGTPDAEDAYQETFLRFAQADETCFASDEHRKAWLLKVAANICRDMLRSAARKNTELDDRFADQQASASPYDTPDSRLAEVLDAMARLDDPPKTPLYLALYEGYRARDIAQMLDAPENTVYSWISRGKKMLREALI